MKRRRHTPEQILRKLREAGPEGVGAGNLVSAARRRWAVTRLQQVFGGLAGVGLPAGQATSQHPTPSASPARPAQVLQAELRRLGRSHPCWAPAAPTPSSCSRAGSDRKAVQRRWREEGLRLPIQRRTRQRLGSRPCMGADYPVRPDHRREDSKPLNVVNEHTCRELWQPAAPGARLISFPGVTKHRFDSAEAVGAGTALLSTAGRSASEADRRDQEPARPNHGMLAIG